MAVQTITYEDKQYLNQNADIPATNKVQDTDMNEIKSVVNNNATETSSNTTNISNITGQILWTNPNPTNPMEAQTITLSSSNYDMYEVIFYGSITGADTLTTGRIPKGGNFFLQQIYNTGTGDVVRNRKIQYVSDTSMTVTDGTQGNSQNNNANIPTYIIGYKTGLFI